MSTLRKNTWHTHKQNLTCPTCEEVILALYFLWYRNCSYLRIIQPCHEKICLLSFCPCQTKSGLCNHRRWLDGGNCRGIVLSMKQKQRCWSVVQFNTAQLICTFVLAYAKSRLSHDVTLLYWHGNQWRTRSDWYRSSLIWVYPVCLGFYVLKCKRDIITYIPVYSGKQQFNGDFLMFSSNKSFMFKKRIIDVSVNHLLLQMESNSFWHMRTPCSWSVPLFSLHLISIYFLKPEFQACSHLLWLYSLVCVRPGREHRRQVSLHRSSYIPVYSGKQQFNGDFLIFSSNKSFLFKKRIMEVSVNHLLLQMESNSFMLSIIRFWKNNTVKVLNFWTPKILL